MKREWMIGILAFILLSVSVSTGCGNNEAEMEKNDVKPVSVLEIREESRTITLHYTGTVEPENTRALSFKTSGKIAEIFVEEGQMVKNGDRLALLEQEDLSFSLAAAKAQMEGARAQYELGVNGARDEEIELLELDLQKARSNYDFLKDHYGKVKALNEAGVVSEQDLNEAGLRMEQARDSMEQAAKRLELTRKGARDEEVEGLFRQYEMAQADYEAKKKMMEDSLITADSDGYVLRVVSQKNEVVAPGHPVVVLSSTELRGRIGLTRDDLSKVSTGDTVDVLIDNEAVKGTIAIIQKIPDEESRTYMADILISNSKKIYIGAIINVTIPVGEKRGAWIPLNCVLNDGADYVFVVEDDRAKRRSVELKSIREDEVCVAGLKEGDLLITEGFKSIKDGYAAAAQLNNY